ncbi:MAG: hypothetical protein C5S41_02595 [Candidatus Methanomarinus sp.]|nr:MAG: hypothetical protein C5S41_02595 [ANME-2 cluster archaeon]
MNAMIIYKTTRKEYVDNALKKGRIRIGTIFYYKQFEDEAIGDPSEGLQPYLLSPEENTPMILSGEEADRIFKRSGFSFRHEWTLDLGIKGKLLIDNMFNTFMFCCSYSESNNIKPIKEFGDSLYIINDPVAFGHFVGKYIGKNILPKYKTKDGKIPDRYYFDHRKVNYTVKTKEISDTKKIPNFDKKVQIDDISTKDLRFAYQNEYRFSWYYYYSRKLGNQIVCFSNKPEFVDIESEKITKFLNKGI